MIARRALVAGFCATALLSAGGAGRAADPPKIPSGKVVLAISGKITKPNHGDVAEFDREMLEEIGMTTVQTSTPWYKGVMTFEGVPMAKLLAYVGAEGQAITALALNDYSTTIPTSDFDTYKVILALKRNGNYMPVSDKGPLFIVYPFDSDTTLQQQKYYSRAAWQVARLVVQ
jgi:hypothetical protein